MVAGAKLHRQPSITNLFIKISDVRLGTCMMDFRGFFPLCPYLGLGCGLAHPVFIEDLVAQLADAANGNRFAMLFMAIDGQQDIAQVSGLT